MVEAAKATCLHKKVMGLRLCAWLFLLLAAPFLIWGALNLLFSTTFGTGFIERKVEGRIGLRCQIESVTWSPWAGVTLRDFDLYAPKGVEDEARFLRVGQVRLDLSWGSLMKGKKRFERLEVRDLLGELSIEQLKEILARRHQKYPVMVVEKTEVDKPPVAERPASKPSEPKVQPEVSPKEEKEQEVEVVAESVPVDDFEGALILENVNFHLYSEKWTEVEVNLCELGAEIPVWGRARGGEMRVGSLKVGRNATEFKEVFPLSWDGGSIKLEENKVKLFGVDLEISAEVRVVEGLPMGVLVNLPDQQMDLTPIYPKQDSPMEVGQLSSRNILRGSLLNFGSYSGRSVTVFKDFVFHDPKDGGDTRFDRGSAVIKLNSAGIVASDVRAIGESDSVLMNGFLTTGGAVAATVRVVSSPERAASHEERIRDASLGLSVKFSPLVTPDREFRDIRIEDRSGTLVVNLGVNEEWVPLLPAVHAILGGAPATKLRLP